MKRVATALVLVPVAVWLVLLAPEWAFETLLALVGLVAFHEFDQIIGESGVPRPGWIGMAGGLALMLAPSPDVIVVMIAIGGMLLALRVGDLKDALSASAVFIFGVVYIFGAWRCAIELRAIDPHWLLFALLLGWIGDTAALYVGRSMGRHRMAPRVSPGKTWEGAAGSLIGSVAGGAVYAHYLIPSASMGIVIGLAAAGNIAGQAGDLCESAIKRGAGVKDSGTSLPGHGGWLDRIDSNLFSVPVVYALLKLIAAL
jgi:phosphatidate cytidylyltransferase